MLICTRRWLEPDETFMRYEIFDTDDSTEEELRIDKIKLLLSQGVDILGLSLADDGRVSSTKDAYTVQEYRYCNNKNMHIPINKIDIAYESNGLFVLRLRGTITDYTYIFVLNDKVIGKVNMNKKDPVHKSYYIDINWAFIYDYNGKPVIECSFGYYDKHYYREDAGESFSRYFLLYNNHIVGDTDWCNNDTAIDLIVGEGVITSSKFVWGSGIHEVDLDLWK